MFREKEREFLFEDERLVRDALQCKILSEIFSADLQKHLILKGGFAMRALFGSERMTKDIDFEADHSLSLWHLKQAIRHSLERALKLGIITDPKVTEPKQTETTLRWKVNGFTHDGTPIHVTVEVSRRNNIDPLHLDTRTFNVPDEYGIPAFKVESYDDQAMAGSKVYALVSENRVAPRDLFDLDILIRSGVEPPVDFLLRKGVDRVESALNDLWTKIEMMDWELFSSEVIPFLPEEVSLSITPDDFEEMRIRVGERVEKWLIEAKNEGTQRRSGSQPGP